MRRIAVVVCGLALALASGPGSSPAAAAGHAAVQPAVEPAMQVFLVRGTDAGCEPQCPEWIAAQGRIDERSVTRFRAVLRQLGRRKVPVLIDSGGGRVSEAFAIGRLARSKGLDIVVSRTLLETCATADRACHKRAKAQKVRLGVPAPEQSKCASACAFILAAGSRRIVGPQAYVGVHQIRSFYVYSKVLRTYRVTARRRQLISERHVTERVVETPTPQRTYDEIARYFAEMGVGGSIMPLILATPGDRLHWLTWDELADTRLATDRIDAGQLLAGPASPAKEPALEAPPADSEEPAFAPSTAASTEALAPASATPPR